MSRQVVTSLVEPQPHNNRGTEDLIYPVVGKLTLWTNVIAPSKFMEFKTPTIEGLVFVNGSTLEILAVHSHDEGRGAFRNFVKECKEHYSFVRLWAVMNDALVPILERYGFVGGFDVDEYGDMVDVFDWKK